MTADLSPLRSGRVTGSRAGAILGLKKGTTADDVLREMVRDHFGDAPEFVGNWMTEHGNRWEEPARAAYEALTGRLVLNAQEFIRHPEHDWLGVSPDGLVGDDGAVEIKVPTDWAKWQTISDKPEFGAQVQLLLACTGRAWVDFIRYRAGEPLTAEQVGRVPADPDWLPTHLPALREFHERYQAIIADPKLAAPYRTDLVAVLDDGDSLLEETELAQVQARIETLEARESELRESLRKRAEATGAKTVRGRWYQITRVNGRGKVRYADAVKSLAPMADLSEFTDRPAGPSFRFTRVKEEE